MADLYYLVEYSPNFPISDPEILTQQELVSIPLSLLKTAHMVSIVSKDSLKIQKIETVKIDICKLKSTIFPRRSLLVKEFSQN